MCATFRCPFRGKRNAGLLTKSHFLVQVVLRFLLLLDIRSLDELESYLSRAFAGIDAGIEGFTTNQLLGLVDFTKVR